LQKEVRVLAAELQFVQEVLPEVGAESVVRIDLIGELLGKTLRGIVNVEHVLRIIRGILHFADRERACQVHHLDRRPSREGPIKTDGFAAGVVLKRRLSGQRIATGVASYRGRTGQSESDLPIIFEGGDSSQTQPSPYARAGHEIRVRGVDLVI